MQTVLTRANQAVQGRTANTLNLKDLLPLGIIGYALFFVNPALAAAQWLSWIQLAWSAYFDLHQDEPVHEVARQVDALRSDIAGLRALLEQRFQGA